MKLTEHHIQTELFASGDIFWNKKTGERVLITKAHDVINSELVLKLLRNDCDVTSVKERNGFNDDVVSWFEASSKEVSIKTKIGLRKKIIRSIVISSIGTNTPSFAIDELAWRMFSLVTPAQAHSFIAKDYEAFKRALSMAGSFTLCAYLTGCYDEKFLRKTYSEILSSFLSAVEKCPVVKLKSIIDVIRLKDSLDVADRKVLNEAFRNYHAEDFTVFERADGSGPKGFVGHELSDLERILIGVHKYFGFNSSAQQNILEAISLDKVKLDRKILSIIKHELSKKENTIEIAG